MWVNLKLQAHSELFLILDGQSQSCFKPSSEIFREEKIILKFRESKLADTGQYDMVLNGKLKLFMGLLFHGCLSSFCQLVSCCNSQIELKALTV